MSLSNLIVPVLNRYDLLCRMLDSIDYPIDHLLVIDNGRGMPEIELPEMVQEMTVLSMPANLGVATSWNLGIKSFPFASAWWFSSADTQYLPGALKTLAQVQDDEITLAGTFPHWQTFAIGSRVVERIGLFDENYHPIYFEDNDYALRASRFGIQTRYLDIRLRHDNSSTIASDARLAVQNMETFSRNQQYFESKQTQGDLSAGQWSLSIRRANNWQL